MAKSQKTEWRIVDDLTPYQDQVTLFGKADEASIKELAQDIDRRGLREPIEILSNGTIIAGHKRLAALILLGHTKVKVIVRRDLDEDPNAAHREFILSNLMRRNLSPLQTTKCYLEMASLYPYMPFKNDVNETQTNYSLRLDEVLGCGPKNAERWKKAALAPLEVQDALAGC